MPRLLSLSLNPSLFSSLFFTRNAVRNWARRLFFIGFVFAPVLDIFRLDLTQGHCILLGQPWTLSLPDIHHATSSDFFLQLVIRVFLPVFSIILLVLAISWRYGRLYCGWLCPHFTVVTLLNHLLIRASGKPSLWERKPLPTRQPDGHEQIPHKKYYLLFGLGIISFATLWAITLLSYLLPPFTLYFNLLHGQLTRNQTLFLGVATLLFTLEFLLARHFFCRFGCAVGVFQSLAWMGNPQARVVQFNKTLAKRCMDCNKACENQCPMRLKPRAAKRHKFSCTQCLDCVTACEQVQAAAARPSLLSWVDPPSKKSVVKHAAPITLRKCAGRK